MLKDERSIDTALEARVRHVVADRVGVDADVLVADLLLADELALDSLDVIELAVDLEHAFHVRIPDRLVHKLRTFGDVVRTVRVLVARSGQRTDAGAPPPPLAQNGEERRHAIVRKADWPRLAMAIVSSAGELLDALQRERLFAAAHLSAADGRFEPDLEQQQAHTRDVREGARGLLRAAHAGLGDVVDGTWKRAFTRLLEVEALRSHVVHRRLTPPEALEAYAQACAALLECAAIVPASLADPALARSAVAMHAWLCAKEQIGGERAQLVGTFVGGRLPPSDPSAHAWLTDSLKALDGMKAVEDGQTAMGLERANRVVSVESTGVALAH